MIEFVTPTSLVQPFPHVWSGDPALGLDQDVPVLPDDPSDEQREHFAKARAEWIAGTSKDYDAEVARWDAYRVALETGELAGLGVGGAKPTVIWLRPGLGKLPDYVRGLLAQSATKPQLRQVAIYTIAAAVVQRLENATGLELKFVDGECGPVLADETMAILRMAHGLLTEIAARAVRAYDLSRP